MAEINPVFYEFTQIYKKPTSFSSDEASFRCLNCITIISGGAWGTSHRNHCPLCLYSKHVDLKTPGDRRSTCGARMKPVGLTLKSNEELAIAHQCLKCGKISCNRIAGDDNPYSLLSLLEEPAKVKNKALLTLEDKEQVLTALFGYNHPDI